MGLFDNYGVESPESTIETNDQPNTTIFDSYGVDSNEGNTESVAPVTESEESNETPNLEKPTTEETSESNESSESTPNSNSPKSLSYDDIDAYFKKQKDFEATQNELAKYKEAERVANEAALKAEQDKANEMPDPVYKPDEYRKWVYEQNANIRKEYDSKLESAQMRIVADNITRTLESSYDASVEKYGNDVVSKAEQWAAGIIKQYPKEAMELLKSNPSWDYIVKEYQKNDMEQQYRADPEAYINAQIEARLAARTNAPVAPIVQQETKKPVRSINAINTSPDPAKSVPLHLQGLF